MYPHYRRMYPHYRLVRRGPMEQNVYERGLVARRISARSVLDEHQAFHQNTSQRVFTDTTIGFVSPWAPRADEAVWRFGRKLTHVSPVMYDALDTGNLRSKIGEAGGTAWLKWLRSASRSDRGAALQVNAQLQDIGTQTMAYPSPR